jgi:hypothetical protein
MVTRNDTYALYVSMTSHLRSLRGRYTFRVISNELQSTLLCCCTSSRIANCLLKALSSSPVPYNPGKHNGKVSSCLAV